jgi:hypothetical protein
MRRIVVIATVAISLFTGAWEVQARAAAQTGSARAVTVAQLQREVNDLQRRVKVLALLSVQHTTEINAIQNRKLTVTRLGGTPVLMNPTSAAAVSAGSCINGVAVSAGIVTKGAYVVGVTMTPDAAWTFLVWNPLGATVLATPEVECLSW